MREKDDEPFVGPWRSPRLLATKVVLNGVPTVLHGQNLLNFEACAGTIRPRLQATYPEEASPSQAAVSKDGQRFCAVYPSFGTRAIEIGCWQFQWLRLGGWLLFTASSR